MADDELAPKVSEEEAAAAAFFDAQIGEEEGPTTVPPAEEASSGAGERPDDASIAQPADPAQERNYEAEARAMGWKPKEEWSGDPDKHRDAQTFVELADNDPAILRKRYTDLQKEHERTLEGLTRATSAQIARDKLAAEARAREQVAAIEARRDQLYTQHAGDPAAIQQITRDAERAKEEVPQPAPEESYAWVARNPQYNTDPEFNAMAFAAMDVIQNRDMAGKPLSEQFAELDKRLARRFPEYYPADKLPSSAPTTDPGAPPANSRSIEGVRVAPSKVRESFDSLPADAKAMFARLKEDGIEVKKEDFAKDYYDG